MAGRAIEGSCHCGTIGYTLRWPEDTAIIPVRACGCDFCRKHRGVWTSHPEATLEVRINDASKVELYRFGTGTADFHVCRNCGVVPVVTSTIDGTRYGVVNTNCFDDADGLTLDETRTDFGAETTEDRLGRRARNWISGVRIVEAAS